MGKKKNGSMAIGFCLDESGSMSACYQATISGFNEYVDDLRKQGKTVLSVTKFSSQMGETYRPLCEAVSVKDAPKLNTENFRPGGGTPLFDAIGHTVNRLEKQTKGEKHDSVLFVIQTDGEENQSREFTREMIVDLIKRKEKDGWKFIYLGADQDAMTAERAAVFMGMAANSSLGYSYATTDSAFGAVATATSALRSDPTLTSASVMSVGQKEYKKRTKK